MKNPIKPVEVQKDQTPVKEVIITGDDIVNFPVTVTKPGTEVPAYVSVPIWVAKDPETGFYMGWTYRSMLKVADRT
jgi:hypothetical protein